MNNEISIRPSKDLRTNYAQIASLAHDHPVAITVNGREDTVIMSHESFTAQQRYITEMEEKLAFYARLLQSADDIRLGRVQPADVAINEILGDLDGTD